ncbi:MAG: hypothetical protein V4734_10460 [Terriglobus sp.]
MPTPFQQDVALINLRTHVELAARDLVDALESQPTGLQAAILHQAKVELSLRAAIRNEGVLKAVSA